MICGFSEVKFGKKLILLIKHMSGKKTQNYYRGYCGLYFFIIFVRLLFCFIYFVNIHTVKILKIGTPEIITIIVLQLEQLDFTVQYCVQKMQTE